LSRDNVLSIVIGILIGFIAGYLLHEVMAARQPPRLVHGEEGPIAPGGAAAAGPNRAGAEALVQEIRSLEAYLLEQPNDADAVLRLANLSWSVENWSGCVESFQRYLELRPESAGVLSDLGICYRSLGRPDRALELFDRAQRLDPGHYESRFNEAVVLGLDQRQFEAAERVIEELRALQPDDPQVEALAEEIARRRSAA
jgi:Flp pilus assembly protein TadD